MARTKRIIGDKLSLGGTYYEPYDGHRDWSGYVYGSPYMGTTHISSLYATARPVATTIQTIVRVVEKAKYHCDYCGRNYNDDNGGSCNYCGASLKVKQNETM